MRVREDFKTTTERFADWLIFIEKDINHLKTNQISNRTKIGLHEELADDMGTPRHDVNQLAEGRNEIGTDNDLRARIVADRLGRVGTHLARVPGVQILNMKGQTVKTETFNVSRQQRQLVEGET